MTRDRLRPGHPRPDSAPVSLETGAASHDDGAAPSEAATAQADASASGALPEDALARTPDGRFRDGHTGNPRGRPRKPKATPDTVLAQLLDEELPNNTPGLAKRMSVREALIRSLCVRALKDPRIALSLLKLDALRRDAPDEGEDLGPLLAEEEAALDAYLARERRRSLPRSRTGEEA